VDMIGEHVPTYLEEVMDRIAETENEQLARVGAITAKPFFVYQQNVFPYIIHRLADDLGIDQSSDEQYRTFTVLGRFVGAHIGSGVPGEGERLVNRYEPVIVSLFTQNIWLKSAKYPTEMPEMIPSDSSSFSRGHGTRAYDNTHYQLPGHLGFEFSLQIKVVLDIKKRY